MKNHQIGLSLLFIILPFIFNSSCTTVKRVAKKITIESGEIPPDMANESFTLVGVLRGKNSYDKYLKKGFAQYTGDYVLATEEELEEKYSDPSKYRYIMDFTLIRTTKVLRGGEVAPKSISRMPFPETRTTYGYHYYIIDQANHTKYERNHGSSFFAKEIRAYLMAIEAVRKK